MSEQNDDDLKTVKKYSVQIGYVIIFSLVVSCIALGLIFLILFILKGIISIGGSLIGLLSC